MSWRCKASWIDIISSTSAGDSGPRRTVRHKVYFAPKASRYIQIASEMRCRKIGSSDPETKCSHSTALSNLRIFHLCSAHHQRNPTGKESSQNHGTIWDLFRERGSLVSHPHDSRCMMWSHPCGQLAAAQRHPPLTSLRQEADLISNAFKLWSASLNEHFLGPVFEGGSTIQVFFGFNRSMSFNTQT